MLKKFIGLGLVLCAAAAVPAIAAGCSSSSTGATGGGDSGTKTDSGAKTDSGSKPPIEAGTSTSPSTTACPAAVTSADIPTYVGPGANQKLGQCTAGDITAFTTSTASSTSTPDDWYKSVSTTCQTCIFSGENDAAWGLVVLSPDLATGLAAGANAEGFLNIGPCFTNGPGGSAACGKGSEDFNNCAEAACPSPTCDSNTDCVKTASSGTCTTEATEFQTGCGASLNSLETYCDGADGQGTLVDLVQAVCGSGSGDAGAD